MNSSPQLTTINDVSGQHLWFRRGQERFSLAMPDLVEVKKLDRLRPLPLAQDCVVGFVKFRNQVLPIFDPLSLAGLPAPRVQLPLTAAFASIAGRPAFGLVLDEVGRIVSLLSKARPFETATFPGAFAGKCELPGNLSVLTVNVAGLAAAMQLAM